MLRSVCFYQSCSSELVKRKKKRWKKKPNWKQIWPILENMRASTSGTAELDLQWDSANTIK